MTSLDLRAASSAQDRAVPRWYLDARTWIGGQALPGGTDGSTC